MDDGHARAGHFGEGQCAMRRLALHGLAVGDDMVADVGAAEIDQALARAADGGVVFGMDHDDPAEAARGVEDPEEEVVVDGKTLDRS